MRTSPAPHPSPNTTHPRRSPLYKKYNLGTTVFSALAGGLLTGKVCPSSPRPPPCSLRTADRARAGAVQRRHPGGLALREPPRPAVHQGARRQLRERGRARDACAHPRAQRACRTRCAAPAPRPHPPAAFHPMLTGDGRTAFAPRRARLQDRAPRARVGRAEPEHEHGHPRRVAPGAGRRQPARARGDPEADASCARADREHPEEQARAAGACPAPPFALRVRCVRGADARWSGSRRMGGLGWMRLGSCRVWERMEVCSVHDRVHATSTYRISIARPVGTHMYLYSDGEEELRMLPSFAFHLLLTCFPGTLPAHLLP